LDEFIEKVEETLDDLLRRLELGEHLGN
jgi:hypothetical protein